MEARNRPVYSGRTRVISGLLLLLSAASGLSVGGCSSEGKSSRSADRPERANARSKTTTIVFLDPTTSKEATGAFADSLQGIAESQLSAKGDQIKAYQIRDRTAIKTPQMVVKNKIDPAEQSEFVDLETMRKARVRQKKLRLIERADSLLRRFLKETSIENRPSSDLLGALEVILEEKGEGAPHVYFFSDMYQVGAGDMRNFEYRAPRSHKEARAWAERDAEKIRTRLSRLKEGGTLLPPETQIYMVPAEGAKRKESPNVETYWRVLFEDLGVTAGHISYN